MNSGGRQKAKYALGGVAGEGRMLEDSGRKTQN